MVDRINEIMNFLLEYKQINGSSLIYKIFKNNKKLLYDMKLIEKMIITIFMIIYKIRGVNRMKINYLRLTGVFLKYKNQGLKKNKLFLITTLGQKQFSSILILNDQNIFKVIDEEYYYVIQLDLLNRITKGCNYFMKLRCQTYVPLEGIIQQIHDFSKRLNVQKHIWTFILVNYIQCDKDDCENIKLF